MSTHYPTDVFAGKQGFLFYPWYTVLEQLCQASVPTDRGCTKWKLLFEARHAWCDKKNIRYLTLVIPERHVIYEDLLPDDIKISPNRATMRLEKALEAFATDLFLYPEAELKQARGKGDVFFKTDEHLNPHGTYTCYKYLLDHLADLGLTAHTPEDYSRDTFQFTGNIGIHLDTEPSEQAEDWHLTNKKLPLQNESFFREGRKYLEITKNPDKALPKALFFGDSHAEFLKKFLSPHFSKIVTAPYCHKMFYDLVEHVQPDIVVHIMAEHRFAWGFLDAGDQPTHTTYADIDRGDFEDYFDMSLSVFEKSVVAELTFSPEKKNNLYLLNGWGALENDFHWMLGSASRIALDLSCVSQASPFLYVEIKQIPFLHLPNVPEQRIGLSCKVGSTILNLEEQVTREAGMILWKIDTTALHTPSEDLMILTFEHPNATAPSTVKEDSDDSRVLSFAVSKIKIYVD